MRIVIGNDHRGFDTKRHLIPLLEQMGHVVQDLGACSAEGCDYPDFAFKVGQIVGTGQAERGLLICGTGIGMCMAANKVPGVRAALCHDSITAEMSRRHNDANVLCLSADLLGEEVIDRMIRIWLTTDFDGGRHARRVDKITRYEAGRQAP
jgi:ribose 5-phosphate isomerase B